MDMVPDLFVKFKSYFIVFFIGVSGHRCYPNYAADRAKNGIDVLLLDLTELFSS